MFPLSAVPYTRSTTAAWMLLPLLALVSVTAGNTASPGTVLELERRFEARFSEINAHMENRIAKLEKKFKNEKDDLEARVAKLEELAKMNVLRSCAEYSQFGFSASGLYMVDPDGALLGEQPFQVFYYYCCVFLRNYNI